MFSIITVTYNDLQGLKQTYESIRNQTYREFNWIIVDNNSTDGTAAFVRGIHNSAADICPIYIREPDAGIYDAMNKGINNAIDPYLIFMNSGDKFHNVGVLADSAESLRDGNVDILVGDSLEVDIHGQSFVKKCRTLRYLQFGMISHHQSMFFRKRLNLKYDTSYRVAADYDLMSRLVRDGARVKRVSLIISIFERGGLSQTNFFESIQEQLRIQRLVHKASNVKLLTYFFIKLFVHNFRNFSPFMYDRLRFTKH